MAQAAVSTLVGYDGLPERVRCFSDLTGVDYADLFVVAVDGARTKSPRQWMVDAFGGAPGWVRVLVPIAHRRVLGLRLEESSRDDPIGWSVSDERADWIRLEASGRLFTANLIGMVDDGHVSLATFMRYENPASKLLWAPVSILHRYVARRLMALLATRQSPIPTD